MSVISVLGALLRVLAVSLALSLSLSLPAMAQTDDPIDYEAWRSFATQAEDRLEDGGLSKDDLGRLRNNAVEWRDQLAKAQDANLPRIQSVKDQIAALGPVPAEGETESADVAQLREALNEQLAELQAPGIKASEAFSRADALIQQADQIKAARAAEEILTLSPSPLLPSSWRAALGDLVALWTGLSSEISAGLRIENLSKTVPRAALYLISALVVLIWGRRVVDSLPRRLSRSSSGDLRAVIAFVVSLGQILLPMLGVFLLAWGIDALRLLGAWATPVLLALPLGALVFLIARWLNRALFDPEPVAYPTLNMAQHDRRLAGAYGNSLAIVLGVHVILANAVLPLSGFVHGEDGPQMVPYEVSLAGAGVMHLVLLVIGGVLAFNLATVLRRLTRQDGPDGPAYRARILSALGLATRIIAVGAIGAAMFGYVNGANAVFWPWVKSLGMVGILIVAQDFIADLYAYLRKSREGARDSLLPMVLGAVMVLASVPLFALIWGATVSDLAEWRASIARGVSLGGFRLSPGAALTFVIVFTLGYLATRWTQGALRNTVLPRTKLDDGAKNAAVAGAGYLGIFFAALFAITSAGIDLSSLAIVAGALSVGLGFGLQNIVSNFVSGIILLIERPISVGDWIEAGGRQGYVTDISVRSTRIHTFDKTDVIVPNSDLISQPVTNWTRGNARGRIIVPVGVAYGTDTRKVERILQEIAEDQPTVLFDPPPAVLFQGFGADSLDFEIRAILSDINGGLGVASTIRHEIIRRFTEEEIEIPFAQRDLWLRNPEVLRQPAAPDPAPQAEAPSAPPPDPRSAGRAADAADGADGGDADAV